MVFKEGYYFIFILLFYKCRECSYVPIFKVAGNPHNLFKKLKLYSENKNKEILFTSSGRDKRYKKYIFYTFDRCVSPPRFIIRGI